MQSTTLLSELKTTVSSIISITESDFLNIDNASLNFKENQSSWSILECFEHLNAYCRFYNRQFERGIASYSGKPFRHEEARSNWIGRKFISMMRPDNLKKTKTLKHMDPSNSKLDATVLDEFLNHQRNLLQILESAGSVSLNSVKVQVEFLRVLRMRLGDALQFVVVHEQRHLLQARAVLKRNGPALKI